MTSFDCLSVFCLTVISCHHISKYVQDQRQSVDKAEFNRLSRCVMDAAYSVGVNGDLFNVLYIGLTLLSTPHQAAEGTVVSRNACRCRINIFL